jgi:hypothetical protein
MVVNGVAQKSRALSFRTGSGSDRSATAKSAIADGVVLGFFLTTAGPVATAPGSDAVSRTHLLTFRPKLLQISASD